jgi:N-acetylglucosamine-6-sulfatase
MFSVAKPIAGGPSRKERSLKRIQSMGLDKLSGRAGATPTTGGGEYLAGRMLLVILACSAALLVAGCQGSEISASETSAPETSQEEEGGGSATDLPNIVFVLTDDLGYASVFKMPEIRSRLVEEGISLEAFVSHPICCPSRATFLTGLYDHNHGVKGNAPPEGGFQTFVSEGHEENSIAVALQESGYQTAFFGKYLNGYPNGDPTHIPPGWDEWYGKLDEQKLYDYRINENGEEVSYGSETEDFFTDVLSGHATDFVSRAAPEDQPFFAYVAPTAPHGPATPAERHKGAFAGEEAPRPPSFDEEDVSDKPSPINDAARITEEEASNIDDYYRQRLESMLAVDEMVEILVEELEAAGELDNTYIFFTSDNGWFQGEHRIQSTKNRPYEESARVPLFVRGPGVPTDTKTEKLAINTDLAPTFAELAGTSFAADGRSLAPLLRGEEPASWRSSVLLEKLPQEGGGGEEGNGKGKVKAKGKEGKTGAGGVPKSGPGQSPDFQAVRTETHKYVEYDNGDVELYDLESDPYELESLHESADPTLLEDLKARLEALRDCSEEGCWEAEDIL